MFFYYAADISNYISAHNFFPFNRFSVTSPHLLSKIGTGDLLSVYHGIVGSVSKQFGKVSSLYLFIDTYIIR